MLNFTFKRVEEPKKPKYGMVIALTAVGVAVVETAAVITLALYKKLRDKKIASQNFDTDFESYSEDCSVDFEDAVVDQESDLTAE